MLFNSLQFLFFLPLVFFLYWGIKERKAQNLLIVVASYVFYGWWDWRFLLLIALTSVCSYLSGIYIDRRPQHGRQLMVLNLLFNLGILGVFKYYNFFAENFSLLLHTVGLKTDLPTLNIILPVGISFYTFQALSYTIDVYRRQLRATTDPVEFFAFISFFPQLVAGPIERATNLLPQFQRPRTFDYDKATDGLKQMLWGFFKKIVVADSCAVGVENIFSNYSSMSGGLLFLGGLLFAFQIYGDFSGYSDIAIGTARLFGIDLMRNFNIPYFSRNISEFWSRWHISLTTWFRDYIYIPLGGNREGRLRTLRNTLIVFLLSGIWHGANWTFVCWGLYHALLIIVFFLLGVRRQPKVVAANSVLPSVKECAQMAVTFFLVVIGWIIFRSENMSMAYHYIVRMFTTPWTDFSAKMFIDLTVLKDALIGCAIMLLVEWLQRKKAHGLEYNSSRLMRWTTVRWSLYIFLIYTIFYCIRTQTEFIYFQF